MTLLKKTKTVRIIGDKQEIVESDYFEISGNELNSLVSDVNKGGDETLLREKLLKESKWGET